jgi:hypothetical protein
MVAAVAAGTDFELSLVLPPLAAIFLVPEH